MLVYVHRVESAQHENKRVLFVCVCVRATWVLDVRIIQKNTIQSSANKYLEFVSN